MGVTQSQGVLCVVQQESVLAQSPTSCLLVVFTGKSPGQNSSPLISWSQLYMGRAQVGGLGIVCSRNPSQVGHSLEEGDDSSWANAGAIPSCFQDQKHRRLYL